MIDDYGVSTELKELQETFIKQFEYLKEKAEEITEEAFEAFADNLLEQYKQLYDLFDLRHRTGIQREIALLRARYEKLVPSHWRTKWLKKYRQNTAMDLVDMETDEEAKQFFNDCIREIEMRYLTLEPPHEANREENGGEWEVVGELKEIADEPETAKKSAQNGQESEKAAEDGQTPDSAEPPAEVAESTAESVSEEEEEPKKKRGRRKKEKRGNKKNDGENDQDRQSAGDSP